MSSGTGHTVTRPPPTEPPTPIGPRPEVIGTTVGAAYGLVALASSAAAVVVPTIRDQFDLDLIAGGWVITAFVLAIAATAPIYGRVADRIGTRLPMRIGIALMAVGALAGAAATSSTLLLSARVVQGAGAGAIPVLAPVIIAANTTPEMRSRALSRMAALAASAAAGLLVGAVVAEIAGWRPVVALPALAVLLLPALDRLTSTRTPTGQRLDPVGAAAVALLTVGVTLALQLGASTTTGAVGIGLAGLGAVAAWWASHRPTRFIPDAVLRRRITWYTSLAAATIPASYFALLIAIPELLTRQHGAGPIAVGLYLLPAAIAAATVGPLARRLHRRLDDAQIATIGLTLAAAALIAVTPLADIPIGLSAAFAIVAIAFGLGQAALLTILTASTPDDEQGAALAIFMVLFFTGGSIGATALTTIAATWPLTTATAAVAILPLAAAAAVRRARTLRPNGGLNSRTTDT